MRRLESVSCLPTTPKAPELSASTQRGVPASPRWACPGKWWDRCPGLPSPPPAPWGPRSRVFLTEMPGSSGEWRN